MFTARALQEMEDHIGEPIGRHFDLTYGTSIGGIIALAVAFEVPMSKVVQTFVDYGEAIFPPKPKGKVAAFASLFKRYKEPQYRAETLREVITKLID